MIPGDTYDVRIRDGRRRCGSRGRQVEWNRWWRSKKLLLSIWAGVNDHVASLEWNCIVVEKYAFSMEMVDKTD